MITAVDTHVLADVFSADPSFGAASADALRRHRALGQLVACEVVFAECAAGFHGADRAARALTELRVDFSPLDPSTAVAAGIRWGAYGRSSSPRRRIVADFLIGEHAQQHADGLLTRDRGFYRDCFDDLEIFDPAA